MEIFWLWNRVVRPVHSQLSDLSNRPKKLSDIFLHGQKEAIRYVYKCSMSIPNGYP